MYKAVDLSKIVLKIACKYNFEISNLKLCSIMYYLQLEFLKRFKQPAFYDVIEAWQFGAVVPNVYYSYCIYGATTLWIDDNSVNLNDIPENHLSTIMDVIHRYKDVQIWSLAETIQEDVVYKECYLKGYKKPITLECIKKQSNRTKGDIKMENTIAIKMDNLTEEERKALIKLVEKANKPVGKVWKPVDGEECFRLLSDGRISEIIYADGYTQHKDVYSMSMMFKTEQECDYMREKMKIQKELEDFAIEHNDSEIDWKDSSTDKYFIMYSHNSYCIFIDYNNTLQSNNVYFTSEKIAQNAIKHIGEDRLKKYYFGVEA